MENPSNSSCSADSEHGTSETNATIAITSSTSGSRIDLTDLSDINAGRVTTAMLTSLQGLFQGAKCTNSEDDSKKFEEVMIQAIKPGVWEYCREKRPRMSFLDLPAEIRVRIYGFLPVLERVYNMNACTALQPCRVVRQNGIPSLHDWPKIWEKDKREEERLYGIRAFVGLYASCRLVKMEMDYELKKSVEEKFDALLPQMAWSPIRNDFSAPDITDLVLEVPADHPLDPILKIPSHFFDDKRYLGTEYERRGETVYEAPLNPDILDQFVRLEFNSVTIAPLEDISSLTPRVVDCWCRWDHRKRARTTVLVWERFPKERGYRRTRPVE